MEYNKEFNQLLGNLECIKEFVGLGNPNAKILFIGKECGSEVGTEIHHGSKQSWIDKEYNYFNRYNPDEKNVRNYNHTWQRYQRLYEYILKELQLTSVEKNDKYEINFIENVFTTELSGLSAPKTSIAKTLENFHKKLNERKEYFFKSDFIQDFPIVVIFASDNQYIETYPGEVCELFNVKFHGLHGYSGKDKIWIHYSNNVPKLLIHTRQLTNSISKELIESLAKIISDFIRKNRIEIFVKQPSPTSQNEDLSGIM